MFESQNYHILPVISLLFDIADTNIAYFPPPDLPKPRPTSKMEAPMNPKRTASGLTAEGTARTLTGDNKRRRRRRTRKQSL